MWPVGVLVLSAEIKFFLRKWCYLPLQTGTYSGTTFIQMVNINSLLCSNVLQTVIFYALFSCKASKCRILLLLNTQYTKLNNFWRRIRFFLFCTWMSIDHKTTGRSKMKFCQLWWQLESSSASPVMLTSSSCLPCCMEFMVVMMNGWAMYWSDSGLMWPLSTDLFS